MGCAPGQLKATSHIRSNVPRLPCVGKARLVRPGEGGRDIAAASISPLIPAATVELPDGLEPANVTNFPWSLIWAQNVPSASYQIFRCLSIVSFAQALPPNPES